MKKSIQNLTAVCLCGIIGLGVGCDFTQSEEGGNSHVCEYTVMNFDENGHWYECACGEKDEGSAEVHVGGTATAFERARCEICGEEYGEELPFVAVDIELGAVAFRFSIPAGKYAEATLNVDKATAVVVRFTGDVNVTFGGKIVKDGDLIRTNEDKRTFVFSAKDTSVETAVSLSIEKYVPKPVEVPLSLGDNAIEVGASWVTNGIPVKITAAQTGDYILSAAEGENNACFMFTEGNVTEIFSTARTFYLQEGETVTVYVGTDNEKTDTVDLVLEVRAHEHRYTKLRHDSEYHWHACACGLEEEKEAHVYADGEYCNVCYAMKEDTMSLFTDIFNLKTGAYQ